MAGLGHIVGVKQTGKVSVAVGYGLGYLGNIKTGAAFAFFLSASMLAGTSADATTVVPPGNRNVEQPPVPGASARRTAALKTTYDAKYKKVIALLKRDFRLRRKIEETAGIYDIDPMHIVGAIVGEHTYNVDAYDHLQTYYVKAISYVNAGLAFEYEGEAIDDFVQRPEFERCKELKDSYALWTCREAVWNAKFRDREIDGIKFPNDRFSAVFFQPFYAGQTFGIGQLNPLTALQMSDIVAETSGFPELDHRDPGQVYKTIMDPDLTLPYVAATIVKSIDAYRSIAGYDISNNPGITSTLYNLGNPEKRARALRTENRSRSEAGEAPRMPTENYYGWLVNDRLDELEPLFEK